MLGPLGGFVSVRKVSQYTRQNALRLNITPWGHLRPSCGHLETTFTYLTYPSCQSPPRHRNTLISLGFLLILKPKREFEQYNINVSRPGGGVLGEGVFFFMNEYDRFELRGDPESIEKYDAKPLPSLQEVPIVS